MKTNPTAPLLSESEVNEIEARVNAATEGPWDYAPPFAICQRNNKRYAPSKALIVELPDRAQPLTDKQAFQCEVDYKFMAHARTDIPALIRDWRALKAQLEAATEYGDKLARNYTSLEDVVFRIRVALGATAGEFNPEQSIAALREQLAQLRNALEPLSQNGRLFTFHRNVEEGDYFECGLCHQEAKRWNEIQHHPNCRIQVAKNALEATA